MIGRGIDRPVCIPLLFDWEKNHDYEKSNECEKSQTSYELVMKRAMHIRFWYFTRFSFHFRLIWN